jgi:hypothetical protein
MGQHNVARSKTGTKLPSYIKKRIVVGNKNLQVIAHLGQLRRRADEIRNRPRRPIPDENVKAFSAQNLSDSAPDNPEADYPNIFLRSSGHVSLRAAWNGD